MALAIESQASTVEGIDEALPEFGIAAKRVARATFGAQPAQELGVFVMEDPKRFTDGASAVLIGDSKKTMEHRHRGGMSAARAATVHVADHLVEGCLLNPADGVHEVAAKGDRPFVVDAEILMVPTAIVGLRALLHIAATNAEEPLAASLLEKATW